MKTLLFFVLCLLVALCAQAQTEENIPEGTHSPDELVELSIKALKLKIQTLNERVIFENPEGNRDLRIYSAKQGATRAPILKMQITRSKNGGELTESVQYSSPFLKAGKIVLRRTGEDVKPTDNEALFTLEGIPLPSSADKYNLALEDLGLYMVFEKIGNRIHGTINAYFDIVYLDVTEIISPDQRIRTYKLGVPREREYSNTLDARMTKNKEGMWAPQYYILPSPENLSQSDFISGYEPYVIQTITDSLGHYLDGTLKNMKWPDLTQK